MRGRPRATSRAERERIAEGGADAIRDGQLASQGVTPLNTPLRRHVRVSRPRHADVAILGRRLLVDRTRPSRYGQERFDPAWVPVQRSVTD